MALGQLRHIPGMVYLLVLVRATFGLGFLLLGLLFAWEAGMPAMTANLLLPQEEVVNSKGTIVDVANTSVEINDVKIYLYRYRYALKGKTYDGVARGPYVASYHKGKKVIIESPASDHSHSRIRDFPSVGIINILTLLTFPLIGGGVLLFAWSKNLKMLVLLGKGKLVNATQVACEKTDKEINDQPIFRYVFEFVADNRCHHQFAVEKSAVPPSASPDPVIKQLLYHPANPQAAMLLEDLPEGIIINRNNAIEVDSFWRVLRGLGSSFFIFDLVVFFVIFLAIFRGQAVSLG
jgi:hypothetical protein